MITFLNLKNSLKEREIPAFCIYGNDRWLKLKAVAVIRDAYGIEDDGFGVEKLDAPTYQRIENACCTGNLFGGKKLVLCENFVFPQGRQGAETADALSRLAESADSAFCLAFISETAAGFDKIGAFQTVCCDRLDASSVVKWIIAYGRKQGTEIDAFCAGKICDYCLQDMSRVEKETQKLIDFGEVTERSVEALVHKDTEFAVYDLSKVIANRDAGAAVELYKGLVASGEEPRGLFGLLYNFYRRAYYAKTTELSSDRIADLLSVKTFAIDRAKEVAARYKPMQLKRILDCFDDADKKLKAYADEDEVMTSLIFRLVTA